jgi:hypothetical protein
VLALTDGQMSAVTDAAAPLHPRDRGTFRQAVAARFTDRDQVGDGELGRALRELQREFRNPPIRTDSIKAWRRAG